VSKANKRERQRQNREQRREYEEKLAKRRKMWKTARTFAIIAVPIIVIGAVLSLTNSSDDSKSSPTKLSAPKQTIDPNQAYSATIDTSEGKIELSIDAQQYPISANNFVYLANKGFYDGLDFVRASTSLGVIQTGSPNNTNVGGPGYTVQAEVPTASPAYPVGTVAWAKSGAQPAGSAGSQFFIVTGPNAATLPADYAVIGTVTSGQDVASAIEQLAPASGDGPLTKKVTMKKVKITTKGIVPPSSTTASSTP
jgi:cyclophilin family peptidyl-prolyl cis-trans isomerase